MLTFRKICVYFFSETANFTNDSQNQHINLQPNRFNLARHSKLTAGIARLFLGREKAHRRSYEHSLHSHRHHVWPLPVNPIHTHRQQTHQHVMTAQIAIEAADFAALHTHAANRGEVLQVRFLHLCREVAGTTAPTT